MAIHSSPLEGYVVLDLSRVLSGPYCTMMLRDLGAQVIKVEQPGGGDEARHFLPISNAGHSAYFAAINRGKKSIALDLADTADRLIFDRLLARVDVLVENFRPGVLAKLGYSFELLQQRHPQLVVASISGFGQSGPYRSRPAYDIVAQAMSGFMSVTGHAGTPPTRAGSSTADLAAALFACNGIQAALLQRARTGIGCLVDVAMLEAQIALLEGAIPEFFCSGASPGPIGARHPGSAPFDAFQAADGHVVIAAGSDHLFKRLANVLDAPALAEEPLFGSRRHRVDNSGLLKSRIEALLAKGSAASWVAKFEAAGIPAGPINDVAAMLADPQVASRGALPPIQGAGNQRAPVTPILFSTHPYPSKLPPVPLLDEHRSEILSYADGEPLRANDSD